MIRKDDLDAMVSKTIWDMKDNLKNDKFGYFEDWEYEQILEFINGYMVPDICEAIDKFCFANNIEGETDEV